MKLATPSDQFTKGTILIYNDGRPGHTHAKAKVIETDERSMIVQFDDRADPTKIAFSDPHWMTHLTIAE